MVCAHAVRVAMGKVEGVESVEVSLNEGTATLKLKTANRVSLETVRQIVRDNGFTPKGAEVRVAGRLVEKDGKRALEVNEVDSVYALVAYPEAEARFRQLEQTAVGVTVLVEAYFPESGERPTLRVRDFVVEPDPPAASLSQSYLRELVTSRLTTESSHSGSTRSGASSVSASATRPSCVSSIQNVRPFSRTR